MNKVVKKFAEERKLPVYVINRVKWRKYKPSGYGFIMHEGSGPSAYLSLMKHAKYAMVQSFHGVIFAYQMKKNFWLLDENSREKMDRRLASILSILDVEERVLRSEKDIPSLNLETSIDYSKERKELMRLVCEAEKYLSNI
jgi:hypothetical protein